MVYSISKIVCSIPCYHFAYNIIRIMLLKEGENLDGALKKFGIYDFLGIYIAGAVITAHLTVSFPCIVDAILTRFCEALTLNGNGETLKFIFVFITLAYPLGVIFHELGKILFDLFPSYKIKNVVAKIETIIVTEKCPKISNKEIPFFNKKYKSSAESLLPYYRKCCKGKQSAFVPFEIARSEIKYKDKRGTTRIDKHHAVYAFARSMFLYFSLNFFVGVIYCIGHNCSCAFSTILLVSDFVFAVLFLIRTKRYYISFVKNTYLQYFTMNKPKEN